MQRTRHASSIGIVCDHAQQAPFPEITARGVASRILMSVQSEQRPGVAQVEAHHLVERRAAAARDLPEPGDARLGLEHAAQCQGWYCSTSYGSGGRGPTSDMSPRSTFQNCGSSSRLVLRRKRPIGVTRGSLVDLERRRRSPARGLARST